MTTIFGFILSIFGFNSAICNGFWQLLNENVPKNKVLGLLHLKWICRALSIANNTLAKNWGSAVWRLEYIRQFSNTWVALT
jgi:hypothetical protein